MGSCIYQQFKLITLKKLKKTEQAFLNIWEAKYELESYVNRNPVDSKMANIVLNLLIDVYDIQDSEKLLTPEQKHRYLELVKLSIRYNQDALGELERKADELGD